MDVYRAALAIVMRILRIALLATASRTARVSGL
jgi:hypothetical protein